MANTARKNDFTKIYLEKKWRSDETVSGPNSMVDNAQTALEGIRECINRTDIGIKSILDIGCGDFIWMCNIIMRSNINYLGTDIVSELIADNKLKYPDVNFKEMDVCIDLIPNGFDLIILRDVFIHLSLEDIGRALNNLKITNFKYLMSTTYTAETVNREMPKKRQMYHPLNLSLPPFNFGKPVKLFNNEKMFLKKSAKEDFIMVKGRHLGLWRREDIL
jgi:2-polyprenyl-3-methyl-5-hydroxy-6-metoxy-1,4-benzoquinol methylase